MLLSIRFSTIDPCMSAIDIQNNRDHAKHERADDDTSKVASVVMLKNMIEPLLRADY